MSEQDLSIQDPSVRALTELLLRLPSLTPNDAGCQQQICNRLVPLGFHCETIAGGGVTNLWARRGTEAPLVVLAGHTDVVPSGPVEKWQSPPFEPTIRDGKLYGRGAADMKASIAAFVVAVEDFVRSHPEHPGSVALLITSDEEGPAVAGTVTVCETLAARNERPDFCIVGEPSCVDRLGDVIKHGRRGSLSGRLTVVGRQGHIAYPLRAQNAVHVLAPALAELTHIAWDQGNDHFPPTTFQISNFQAGTGATNVIPGEAMIDFNFRFSTASSPESLKMRVHAILERHNVPHHIDWCLSAEPFLTPPGQLSATLQAAILQETGVEGVLSTTGGTSDARFLAKICSEVVEFGPINASIHQIDEHISIDSLEPLKNIYRRCLESLLLGS